MPNTLTNDEPTLEEQEDILEKQKLMREAMWLPAITQDEIYEIAKKILESQESWTEEK
jgi:hypothetical protein